MQHICCFFQKYVTHLPLFFISTFFSKSPCPIRIWDTVSPKKTANSTTEMLYESSRDPKNIYNVVIPVIVVVEPPSRSTSSACGSHCGGSATVMGVAFTCFLVMRDQHPSIHYPCHQRQCCCCAGACWCCGSCCYCDSHHCCGSDACCCCGSHHCCSFHCCCGSCCCLLWFLLLLWFLSLLACQLHVFTLMGHQK